MIGDFLSGTSTGKEVSVHLAWNNGDRIGYVDLPKALQTQLDIGDWPQAADWMSLDSALAYGLFIAMRTGHKMIVSGDLSAWNCEWGHLMALRRA